VIEHYANGRRVYTLSEAARLHCGNYERAARQWVATTRRRLNRQKVPAAGWINPREPVYYPEDLGIEGEAR
jgi:hypothetical protein